MQLAGVKHLEEDGSGAGMNIKDLSPGDLLRFFNARSFFEVLVLLIFFSSTGIVHLLVLLVFF